MPALDTNLLVRFLVGDDPARFALVKRFVEEAAEDDELFVPLTVSLELEWVLRSRYGFDADTISTTYHRLLETRELSFQDEASLERALGLFDERLAGFADCLHLAIAMTGDRMPMTTFDRKAARMPGVSLLE